MNGAPGSPEGETGMDHRDHVRLLRDGIGSGQGVWADIGAGWGAFTLALADLLDVDARIIAVDRDAGALEALRRAMQARFPQRALEVMRADFTQPMALPSLDGIVMANALHFVRDKLPVLVRLRAYLRPGGRLIVVEYDTDRGNRWVPYPLTYPAWAALAERAGFAETHLLARAPSSFLGGFYAALALCPAEPPAPMR